MRDKTGIVHGRFQVLHIGHMEYLLEAKRRCDYLVIGVTNPDTKNTGFSNNDPCRSEPEENPMTYFERLQIIQGSLFNEGIELREFNIVPFPIDCPRFFQSIQRTLKRVGNLLPSKSNL